MRDWIIIVGLYAFGAATFRLLGGFASAGEALRRWGETAAALRREPTSS